MWVGCVGGRLGSGDSLQLVNISRHDDDVYECVAFNGVPPPATRRTRLAVHCSLPLTHSLGAVYFQPPSYAQLVGGWPGPFTTQHNHIVLLTEYGEESLSYFSLYKSLLTLSLVFLPCILPPLSLPSLRSIGPLIKPGSLGEPPPKK